MKTGGRLYQSRLCEERREVRLLTLLPGTRVSAIQCITAVASLDCSPKFSALSYVWGDPNARSEIYVDGAAISATVNLEGALRHLRGEQAEVTLWVDAVCINQQDVQERNQQVNMMGEIYAAASTVSIWIGEGDARSDTAFDMMGEIARGHVSDLARTVVCSFYLNLTSIPWFGRVWIIQELALAKEDPMLFCGYKSAPWSVFISAWGVLSQQLYGEIGMNKGTELSKPGEALARIKIQTLNDIRESSRRKDGETFQQLYIYSRASEATDPKDRIYGLLGMLNESDRAKFDIDYTKPISTIFTEAMAHIFEKGEGPRFVSGMWLHAGTSPIPHLPTWVPDFSAQTAEKAGHPGSISFHPAHPRSASGAGSGAKNGRMYEDGSGVLKVEALPVGIVKEVFAFGRTVEDCVQQLKDVERLSVEARSIELSESDLKPFYERFRSSEPLWQLLVSGKKHMSGYDPAPPSYGQEYSRLVGESQWSPQADGEETVDEYKTCLGTHLPGRTFFVTQEGMVGVGAPNIRTGDHVKIWFGSPTPFITRPCTAPEEDKCTLIGAAYLGGIMDGEMVDELYCEDLLDSETLFVL